MKSSPSLICSAAPQAWQPNILDSRMLDSNMLGSKMLGGLPGSCGGSDGQAALGQGLQQEEGVFAPFVAGLISAALGAEQDGRIEAQPALMQDAAGDIFLAEQDPFNPSGAVDKETEFVHWEPQELSFSQPTNPRDLAALREQVRQEALEQAFQQAQDKAREILREARQQADEVIRVAQTASDEIKHQARQEGLAAAQKETAGQLKSAENLVKEVKNWHEKMLTQSEPLVIDLVKHIANKLFGEGFTLEVEALKKCFERALKEAATLGALRIRAHPDDIAALGSLWPVQQTAMTGQNIELVPNQEIERGSCYIEGQFGSVDARIKPQLRQIEEVFGTVIAEKALPSDPFIPYGRASGGQAK